MLHQDLNLESLLIRQLLYQLAMYSQQGIRPSRRRGNRTPQTVGFGDQPAYPERHL